jgi:hypothetical protein
VNPRDRLLSAARRNPVEALAQQVTERVVDLLVGALDVNQLAARVDLNAVLARVDLKPLLDRVDVNDLMSRIDMDALVEKTDLGAVIARSSGGWLPRPSTRYEARRSGWTSSSTAGPSVCSGAGIPSRPCPPRCFRRRP